MTKKKKNPLGTELGKLLRKYPDVATMELLVPDVLGIFRGKRIRRSSFQKTCDEQPEAASAILRVLSLNLARRLRNSSADLVRRIDDHEWMRAEAEADQPSWFGRLVNIMTGWGDHK